MIANFSDSTTAKINNGGSITSLKGKFDGKRNLVLQMQNKTKQVDDFQLFEANHRSVF